MLFFFFGKLRGIFACVHIFEGWESTYFVPFVKPNYFELDLNNYLMIGAKVRKKTLQHHTTF